MLPHERILSIGITGSGKSYQWLKMAEQLKPAGAKFFCIDTDNAVEYMIETAFPHLAEKRGGNVKVFTVFDWPDYKQAIDWVRSNKPGLEDWLVLDMADTPWDTVQAYYTSEVFNKNIGDYFLQIRKEIQKGLRKGEVSREAFDGWRDWGVVNKLYHDFIDPLIFRNRCHIYATAKVQKMGSKEDADIKELFSEWGIRPSGQKALGHLFHSILLLIPGKGKWYVTTMKDRGRRKYFAKTPLSDLYMQYLVAKAHWESSQEE